MAPWYTYETQLTDNNSLLERFEFQQSPQDAPLSHHPETGQPVRRVYNTPSISAEYTPGTTARRLDPKHLEKHGWQRIESNN